MFYLLAMACTIIAWAAQAYTSAIKKEKKVNVLLALFDGLAGIFFAIDVYATGNVLNLTLGIITTVLTLMVLFSLITIKQK